MKRWLGKIAFGVAGLGFFSGLENLAAQTRSYEVIPNVVRGDSFYLEVDTKGPVNGVKLEVHQNIPFVLKTTI